jgi:dTMP kinase
MGIAAGRKFILLRSESKMTGKFIVFEGPDGCGKSAQTDRVWKWLSGISEGPPVRTREPGGSALGDKIRELLMDPRGQISPLAQAMLLCAARSQHCERIKRCLDGGMWVVCDRFSHSTWAYQVAGEGMPIEVIQTLDQIARGGRVQGDSWFQAIHGGLEPDLTIILDVPLDVAANRSGASDRFEAKDPEFKARVADAYTKFLDGDRLAHVDGTGSQDEVFDRIKEVITAKLINPKSGQ